MFRGISAINVDSKGRIAVPTRYRQMLEVEGQQKLIVTIDTEQRCLLLYPLNEWEIIEAKVAALPSFNAAARRIQRLLIGHATEIELDNNGRILLPQLLRDHAGLDKQIMLVGQGKKFELWSDKEWEGKRNDWLEQSITAENLPPELQNLAI